MDSAGLLKVELSISTAVDDCLHTQAWSLLRDFSNWGFFQSFDKQEVACSLLPGDREFCIGSRRLLQVWNGQLVEQLSALDDVNTTMSYKLVTHPSNRNPFGAAFVDHACRVTLRPITMTGQSFVEIQASFLTDTEAVPEMRALVTHFHEECLEGLAHTLRRPPPYERTFSLGVASTRPVGSFDFVRPATVQPPGRRFSSGSRSDHVEAAMRQDSSDSNHSQNLFPFADGGFPSGGFPFAKITTL